MNILILFGENKQLEAETWFPEGSIFEHQNIKEFLKLEQAGDGKADVVLALHSLNKLIPEEVIKVIPKIYDVIRTGGEFWAYTPAFEWIAKQAFINDPSPLLHYQVFGTEKSPNRSLYNLAWLRELIVSNGFTPRVATQDRYAVKSTFTDKKSGKEKENTVQLVQNAVIGWKTAEKPITMGKKGENDPASAID